MSRTVMQSNGGFTQLPTELQARIVSYLDVKSTGFLRHVSVTSIVCRATQIAQVCNDRLSVVRYLGQTFKEPEKLLDAMSKNHAYISGTYSLQFFVPGVATQSSTWDFYAPMQEHYLDSMMEIMEACGVMWENYATQLERNIRCSPEGFVVHGYKLRSLLREGELEAVMMRAGLHSVSYTAPKSNAYYDVAVNGTELTCTYIDPDQWGQGYKIDEVKNVACTGRVISGKSSTLVRLIMEKSDRGLEMKSLFDAHSSCLQSFIRPHIACHLYGRMACDGLTYGWRDNLHHSYLSHSSGFTYLDGSIHAPSVPPWKALHDRGFKYIDVEHQYMTLALRRSADEHSIQVRYSYNTSTPRDVRASCVGYADALLWTEGPHCISRIPVFHHMLYMCPLAYTDYWYTQRHRYNEYVNKYVPLGLVFLE